MLILWVLLAVCQGVCRDEGSLNEVEKAVLAAHNLVRAKHVDTEPLCYAKSGGDITYTSRTWLEML